MWRLAQLYDVKGDYENAAPVLRRALDIRKAKLGISDSQTREVYQSTYCTLNKLERKEEIEALSKEFSIKKPVIGDEQLKTNAADEKVREVRGGIVNSKAINLVKPVYPMEARAKRASGAVNVQVTIDEEGNVVYACALSGAKELQRGSEIAAYQSKFSPTLLEGKPVKVTGVIVYNYVP